jgi:hypothetical protein
MAELNRYPWDKVADMRFGQGDLEDSLKDHIEDLEAYILELKERIHLVESEIEHAKSRLSDYYG